MGWQDEDFYLDQAEWKSHNLYTKITNNKEEKNTMKTSKIKQIVLIKDWNGQNGLVYYHSLVMENGDKINIGRKDKATDGMELTYELTGGADDQQEYKKAKAVKPFNPMQGGGKSEPKDQGVITWLSCYSSACVNTQQSQLAGNNQIIIKMANEAFTEAMKHSTLPKSV